MMIDEIRKAVIQLAQKYSISKVTLFGSQADGTATAASDIDLIVEFFAPVTLITLAKLTDELEELLDNDVDIIHGPLRNTDFLEVGKEIEIYAA